MMIYRGGYWDNEGPVIPALSVYADDDPIKSGLLTVDGEELVTHRAPAGFDITPRPRYRVKAGRQVIA
jgi:hypothetical protein